VANKPKDASGRRKPRGSIGTTTFRGGAGVTFNKVVLPHTKEEIERFMIEAFDLSLDRATRQRFGITGFSYLPGNDLDCRVQSAHGDFKMELTELVPAGVNQGGHDAAPPIRSVGETADRMLERIRDKSAKYAEPINPWLLIYVTAWQLSYLANEVLLVRRAVLSQPPTLGRIFLLDATDKLRPELTTIYPVGLSEFGGVIGANIPEVRSLGQFTADPRAWRTVSTKGPDREEQTRFESAAFRVP
jgi:hypothetical protein